MSHLALSDQEFRQFQTMIYDIAGTCRLLTSVCFGIPNTFSVTGQA